MLLAAINQLIQWGRDPLLSSWMHLPIPKRTSFHLYFTTFRPFFSLSSWMLNLSSLISQRKQENMAAELFLTFAMEETLTRVSSIATGRPLQDIFFPFNSYYLLSRITTNSKSYDKCHHIDWKSRILESNWPAIRILQLKYMFIYIKKDFAEDVRKIRRCN